LYKSTKGVHVQQEKRLPISEESRPVASRVGHAARIDLSPEMSNDKLSPVSTLASMIVANHQPEVWALLVEVARREQNIHKVGVLLSAFALIGHDPAITELARELQKKLEAKSS